jgi:hypothetical protein
METELENEVIITGLGEYPDENEGYHGCPRSMAIVA